MASTLILSETAIDYLRFMYNGGPGLWVAAMISAAAAVAVVVDFVLVHLRTWALRASLAAPDVTQLALRSITVATIGIVVLAIASTWLAVSLNRIPREWLAAPHTGLVVAVLVLAFVVPAAVATAICYSVASTGEATSA